MNLLNFRFIATACIETNIASHIKGLLLLITMHIKKLGLIGLIALCGAGIGFAEDSLGSANEKSTTNIGEYHTCERSHIKQISVNSFGIDVTKYFNKFSNCYENIETAGKVDNYSEYMGFTSDSKLNNFFKNYRLNQAKSLADSYSYPELKFAKYFKKYPQASVYFSHSLINLNGNKVVKNDKKPKAYTM